MCGRVIQEEKNRTNFEDSKEQDGWEETKKEILFGPEINMKVNPVSPRPTRKYKKFYGKRGEKGFALVPKSSESKDKKKARETSESLGEKKSFSMNKTRDGKL